jgi:hypothetical protein
MMALTDLTIASPTVAAVDEQQKLIANVGGVLCAILVRSVALCGSVSGLT